MMARKAWSVVWTAIAVTLLTAFVLATGDAAAATFTSTPSGFGFHSFQASFTGTQAGSHPDVTVGFELNNALNQGNSYEPVGGEVRNLAVNLPPGLIGNPTAVPQCTRQRLDTGLEGDVPPTHRLASTRWLWVAAVVEVSVNSICLCTTWFLPRAYRPSSASISLRSRRSSMLVSVAEKTTASLSTSTTSRNGLSSKTASLCGAFRLTRATIQNVAHWSKEKGMSAICHPMHLRHHF